MLTKEYLQRIWQPEDQLFQILIAGGLENISAVVHDLQENGYGNVFGFADRDFRESNRARWGNPSPQMLIYRPDRFEIENYLLDWNALAGCDENISHRRRTQADIEQRAIQCANKMLCWMACRRVLSDFYDRLVSHFPAHPKPDRIKTLQDAENYIKNARNWWNDFPRHSTDIQDSNTLSNDLQTAYDGSEDDLSSDKWIANFPGKEIFRSVRGFLFNQAYAGAEVMDTDLAKSVADWQINNNSVPSELIELKDSMRNRLNV
jgi:hypothetical protein